VCDSLLDKTPYLKNSLKGKVSADGELVMALCKKTASWVQR